MRWACPWRGSELPEPGMPLGGTRGISRAWSPGQRLVDHVPGPIGGLRRVRRSQFGDPLGQFPVADLAELMSELLSHSGPELIAFCAEFLDLLACHGQVGVQAGGPCSAALGSCGDGARSCRWMAAWTCSRTPSAQTRPQNRVGAAVLPEADRRMVRAASRRQGTLTSQSRNLSKFSKPGSDHRSFHAHHTRSDTEPPDSTHSARCSPTGPDHAPGRGAQSPHDEAGSPRRRPPTATIEELGGTAFSARWITYGLTRHTPQRPIRHSSATRSDET